MPLGDVTPSFRVDGGRLYFEVKGKILRRGTAYVRGGFLERLHFWVFGDAGRHARTSTSPRLFGIRNKKESLSSRLHVLLIVVAGREGKRGRVDSG